MSSRRGFLSTLAAGLTVSAVKPTSSLDGPISLQLWNLREYGPKDPLGYIPQSVAYLSSVVL